MTKTITVNPRLAHTRLNLLKQFSAWALLFAASVSGWADSPEGALRLESGSHRVSLIELYTSEGCSSCPPADQWLSNLTDGEALWENVVPVAFHVSYWDRLGWPDRFANQAFDTRQRLLAKRADTGVYTPGLFRDGIEFRRWRNAPAATIDSAFKTASERSPAAGTLVLSTTNKEMWSLRYTPSAGTQGKVRKAFVAILGNNLSTKIKRGENAGKKLNHNFVVLKLASKPLSPSGLNDSSEELGAEFRINTNLRNNLTKQPAIAAWVVDEAGFPVQAVGAPI